MSTKISVNYKYIDMKKVVKHPLKERPAIMDAYYQKIHQRILKLGIPGELKLTGSKNRPYGFEASVPTDMIEKIRALPYVQFVYKIPNRKKKKAAELEFYCVKMTVALQVEDLDEGMQTYEERYVIIKAHSFDEAYSRVEKQAHTYEQTYLNPYGARVRYKIESYDDCYKTSILEYSVLDKPEGAEVYSIFKKRRLTKERVWRPNAAKRNKKVS